MNDIAVELAKLHELKGAEYSRQVEHIARMSDFHPVENEPDVFSTGSRGDAEICFSEKLRKKIQERIWEIKEWRLLSVSIFLIWNRGGVVLLPHGKYRISHFGHCKNTNFLIPCNCFADFSYAFYIDINYLAAGKCAIFAKK